MTVSTSVRKQDFAGGQAALTYTFYSIPDHPEHIKVTLKEIATGDETELTYGVDYTVAQETDGVGGVVTVSPTYSTAYTQTVWRDTTKTQESDYDDYNQFPADTLEKDLDRLMCLTQEMSDDISRAVKNPITNPTSVTLAQMAAYATTCSTQATLAGSHASIAVTASTAATASAAAAAASAAAVNLPTFATGDASKFLMVNAGEDGYDHVAPASEAQAIAGTESTLVMTPLRVKQAILNIVFPIGRVVTLGVSTNPADLFGIGTWTQIKGRVVVGIDDSGTFDTLNVTTGTETVTLTEAQMPAHTHTVVAANTDSGGSAGGPGGSGSSLNTITSSSKGSGSAHNNVQPSIVKYVWERTA
jgi:hypothetical protein